MTYHSRLGVAAGTGRLVRRPHSLLFVPVPDGGEALIAAYLEATSEDLDEVLAEHVLTRSGEAPGFVAITWPIEDSTQRLRIVVRGSASMSSDIASIPTLSGAGSPTWVEHRVARNPATASILGGAVSDPDTDLRSGVVSAGGFHLVLEPSLAPSPRAPALEPAVTALPAADAAPSPRAPGDSRIAAPTPAVSSDDPEVTITAPEVSDRLDEPAISTDGSAPAPAVSAPASPAVPASSSSSSSSSSRATLDALEAAAGADWMDESLQLGAAHLNARHTADVVPPTDTPVASKHPPADDESPSPSEGQPSTPPPVETAPSAGPPVFPGDDPRPEPGVDDSTPATERRHGERLVAARMCTKGHPNSPHDVRCRLCQEMLDLDQAAITVEQPTLAVIRLPDGSAHPVAGDVVIGRNPTTDAARLDGASLIAMQAPSSVSRTHLSVSVDGWRLLVTDCGSSAGSALVIDGEDEPIRLEAWMPHEINGGDRLFLGGPTAISIDEVPSL